MQLASLLAQYLLSTIPLLTEEDYLEQAGDLMTGVVFAECDQRKIADAFSKQAPLAGMDSDIAAAFVADMKPYHRHQTGTSHVSEPDGAVPVNA
ncbi:hypothetical protein A2851_02730 [Candidatus Kaiserbacteria bacterium RIFCSPHIGHO2_01_FULL_53_29]|uniref:Uncharacterized protein n=1 Tax=Candidatus Kaiserbacteria bacterium RIFCSPHIGHO2_01_FULL_53_29 TaxID=1798480 RepID=A0A1F6CVY6_9BACT|nr:MAG: hypothetical protein A2851_02730 [Candidatus Kaiserbacteria bacterium RIFCSPHIGHO2_01_FULL_53_29]